MLLSAGKNLTSLSSVREIKFFMDAVKINKIVARTPPVYVFVGAFTYV